MPPTEPLRNPDVAVERSDAPPRLFAYLAAGFAAVLCVSLIVLRLIYPSSVAGPSDAPTGKSAEPALQTDPAADLAARRDAEQRQLTSYGWIDRANGTVHIPIDQAMRDVVAAGIKDWPEDAK